MLSKEAMEEETETYTKNGIKTRLYDACNSESIK